VIRYALRCACGHRFDAWFASAAAYDAQAEKGLVDCPDCGANTVEKALMAPAIARGRAAPAPAEAVPPSTTPPEAEAAEHPVAMRAALRAMVRRLKRGAEDVGPRFPDEARRIHQGEAEERPIWGRASGEEARALRDEGIEVHALPDVPDHDA
jgi:hypothetical protein